MKIYKLAQAFDTVDDIMSQIDDLMDAERRYRGHTEDIPEMEEATIEDLDAGYGRAIPIQSYLKSLNKPYVSMSSHEGEEEVEVRFHGNYEPSSVNAGMEKTVFVGVIKYLDADELVRRLNEKGIENFR